MRVYLDMCAIQRPMDNQSQVQVVMEGEAIHKIIRLCDLGQLHLTISDAHLYENSRNSHGPRRLFGESVLSLADEYVSATTSVDSRAEFFVQKGIKLMDALHLASAVEARVDYFCTCDAKLLRIARTLDTGATRVVSPLELVVEVTT